MKSNLRIRISRKPESDSSVSCRTVTLRERLMTKLFGSKQRVTVLIPGNDIDAVSITEERAKGGGGDEQGQTFA